jgi:D-alanyl-D-alanine carboxypeptidase
MRVFTACCLILCLGLLAALPAAAQGVPRKRDREREIAALIAAYPDFLERRDGNVLIWKDSLRMRIDDGLGDKPVSTMFDDPDIEDMFRFNYPLGMTGLPPNVDDDPGRVRYQPLFIKMYGDCRTGIVYDKHLVVVPWLPKHNGGTIKFTSVNGASKALERVSAELDELPDEMMKYLIPHSGSYNCRLIAGTDRMSMHSYGAAIDLNTEYTTYWQWHKPSNGGYYFWTNEIPMEIVAIFEKHGFIWGGKWYHYDTMHFEYRPELLAVGEPEKPK